MVVYKPGHMGDQSPLTDSESSEEEAVWTEGQEKKGSGARLQRNGQFLRRPRPGNVAMGTLPGSKERL